MNERRCGDSRHEGTNPLPTSEFYSKPKSTCKACVKRRAGEHIAVFRRELKEFGLPRNATAADLQAARAEFATPRFRQIEEQPEIEPQLVFVNRKPMFTGMVRESKGQSFRWRVA